MGDIPYSKIFALGDRLILHLRNGVIFEGDYCEGGTNRLDLINARQHNNPNALGGLYSFDRREIQCIHYLKDNQTQYSHHNYAASDRRRIDLVEEEYIRLREMAVTYTYIQLVDSRYYKAVNKLMQVENVGVVPLGLTASRTSQLRFLAICTWKEVYLFDLINNKQRFFYPELKELFESEYICKVIHKAGPLIDILFNNYKVDVQNTFDTEVVDLILQKRKIGNCPKKTRTASQCLVEYFNMPSCFLDMALEACSRSWQDRPLRDDQLKGAAQQVTYLLILKSQMEKLLLGDTYNAIYKVHNFCSGLPQEDFSAMCQNNEIPKDIAELIPSIEHLTPPSKTEDETKK